MKTLRVKTAVTAQTGARERTIGILGGFGAFAGAFLYNEIVRAAAIAGAKKDTDFPTIVAFNLPFSGTTARGFANTKVARLQCIAGARQLETLGAEIIIIACNTAHLFAGDIQRAIHSRLVNIIEESIADIRQTGASAVGVLCSKTSRDQGLFTKTLRSAGIRPIATTGGEQRIINAIVDRVIAGEQNQRDMIQLARVIRGLRDRGAGAILIGCTELSIVAQKMIVRTPVFDTATIGARRALLYARSNL